MTLEDEARKKLERYIGATEMVFRTMELNPPEDPKLKELMEESVNLSKIYLEDSKHYFGKGDYITAIVCVAYSEGILDAFRNMGWLKYDWIFREKQG